MSSWFVRAGGNFFLWMAIIGGIFVSSAFANTDERRWTSKDGEVFVAELVSYDDDSEVATFKYADGTNRSVAASTLSTTDRAWLKEWAFVSAELEEKLVELGGSLEHLLTAGAYPTDLFVYNPPNVEEPAQRPLVILFSPSGMAYRYLLRFVDSAAELGAATVACGSFRNTGRKVPSEAEEDQLLARFREVLPQLEAEVPHDPASVVLGGSSGGAWRAYHYAALFDRPWRGILAAGGWLGGEAYYDLPYPANMRVAMVNGNQDLGASFWLDKDSEILTNRGSDVAVFVFEGGHQVPPSEHVTNALRWILDREGDAVSDRSSVDPLIR